MPPTGAFPGTRYGLAAVVVMVITTADNGSRHLLSLPLADLLSIERNLPSVFSTEEGRR